MKTFSTFIVLLLFSTNLLTAGDQQTGGRYQIIPAIIEVVGKTVSEAHVLVRIDTQTGRTWEYAPDHMKDGKWVEGFWNPIADPSLTIESEH